MTAARLRALVAVIVLAVAAAVAIAVGGKDPPTSPAVSVPVPRPASERPVLLLLTSLPLLFAEDFSLEGGGSPALAALQSRYRVVPISVTSDAELARGRLLLMAQPLAQPAENLLALDLWVRRGGQLLLLADPALDWDSRLPLGDVRRPAPVFMDTGLLAHWGLRLDAPDERGPRTGRIGGFEVLTASPGTLAGTACDIGAAGLVARCRIGKGTATIIADADFLNVAGLDGPTGHNLDGLLGELARLERR